MQHDSLLFISASFDFSEYAHISEMLNWSNPTGDFLTSKMVCGQASI